MRQTLPGLGQFLFSGWLVLPAEMTVGLVPTVHANPGITPLGLTLATGHLRRGDNSETRTTTQHLGRSRHVTLLGGASFGLVNRTETLVFPLPASETNRLVTSFGLAVSPQTQFAGDRTAANGTAWNAHLGRHDTLQFHVGLQVLPTNAVHAPNLHRRQPPISHQAVHRLVFNIQVLGCFLKAEKITVTHEHFPPFLRGTVYHISVFLSSPFFAKFSLFFPLLPVIE